MVMATVRPFRALRPVPDKADRVASVPYDVVTTREARTLAEGNPLSFLHVIRPEIDLPDSADPYSDEVYAKAKENLSSLIEKGVLFQEEEYCFYIYRIQAGIHEQTGLACCCSVSEYDSDIIRKHEHTRREKEDDRLRHMLTLSAHAGPVLMTYRAQQKTETLLEQSTKGSPIYDFIAEDGVRHTIWREPEIPSISRAFKEVPLLYIADGHHRAAGASRVRRATMEKNPGLREEEECNFFLAVLFPSDQLRILPYNRYVGDLNGLDGKGFLEKVKQRFEVSETGSQVPEKRRQYCMYLEGKWYLLIPRAGTEVSAPDPVTSLDLSLFQEKLLGPVLGIIDQKNDTRIDFIGGEGSTEKLALRVDQEGGVAFSFFPVSVEELLAVADAHMIMPPKSTWFSPKLRSGLLIHRF
jgi:uncharacterized protein (DUF1015 family)